jgi:serine/threonine-protein kinase
MRPTWLTGFAATVVALAIALAACGSGTQVSAPSGVRTALTEVNAAVRAHEYQRARSALDLLVSRTNLARARQQIDASQATRVLAAAAQLRADLPRPSPPVVQAPAPPPTPITAPNSEGKHKGNGGDGNGQGQGNGHGPGGGEGD